MSEQITHANAPTHIQRLYGFVGHLAQNHNKIVDHLTDLHKNVTALQQNVRALRQTVSAPKSPQSPQRQVTQQ